jgi:hypothetical protein
LGISELFQIIIGATISKYFNGRRITVNFLLVLICVPLEIVQFLVQLFVKDYSTEKNLSPTFYLNAL